MLACQIVRGQNEALWRRMNRQHVALERSEVDTLGVESAWRGLDTFLCPVSIFSFFSLAFQVYQYP